MSCPSDLLPQSLTSDANFLRMAKGTYTLHCFHPEQEQLVRVPPPKEPKEGKQKAAGAGEGATPVAGAEGTEGAKPAKEAVPMVRVEAKPLEVRTHGPGRRAGVR